MDEVPEPSTAPLRGKGFWLPFSANLDKVLEMAAAVGATHLLYRTSIRGMFFVERARYVLGRASEAGLVPLAWVPLSLEHPLAEGDAVLKSLRLGYQGVVLEVGESAGGKTVAAAALGRKILANGGDPQRLFYASFPNIWQHPEIPYREMNQFCRGGFMPWCVITRRRTPKTVVDKWAYGEHKRWMQEWGDMPPIYPILAVGKNEVEAWQLSMSEFLKWVQTLAAHNPPFLSFYGVEALERELWPILASVGPSVAPPPVIAPELLASPSPVAAPGPALPPTTSAEEPPPATARFHVVTVNDTIWGICKRYGISRSQFWEWNGHLWDDQGLPRDEVYMQEGWRVRVG